MILEEIQDNLLQVWSKHSSNTIPQGIDETLASYMHPVSAHHLRSYLVILIEEIDSAFMCMLSLLAFQMNELVFSNSLDWYYSEKRQSITRSAYIKGSIRIFATPMSLRS